MGTNYVLATIHPTSPYLVPMSRTSLSLSLSPPQHAYVFISAFCVADHCSSILAPPSELVCPTLTSRDFGRAARILSERFYVSGQAVFSSQLWTNRQPWFTAYNTVPADNRARLGLTGDEDI